MRLGQRHDADLVRVEEQADVATTLFEHVASSEVAVHHARVAVGQLHRIPDGRRLRR